MGKYCKYVAISATMACDLNVILLPYTDADFRTQSYARLRDDVNRRKLKTLSVCVADENGDTPGFPNEGAICWQFHFKTDDEPGHFHYKRDGITMATFGDRLISSEFGKALQKLTWLSCDGRLDFAAMTKLLTLWTLPPTLDKYLETLQHVMPERCDLAHVIKRKEVMMLYFIHFPDFLRFFWL